MPGGIIIVVSPDRRVWFERNQSVAGSQGGSSLRGHGEGEVAADFRMMTCRVGGGIGPRRHVVDVFS